MDFLKALPLSASSVVLACSSDEPGQAQRAITFYGDVAPILYESCADCHRSGGIGPFSVLSYDAAKAHSSSILAHTADRHMPPMPVDNSGACNTYSNARWLTDDQIGTIAAWVGGGSQQGDSSRRPLIPKPEPGLVAPDLTLDPGFEYMPKTERSDDYRCFVLPAPLAETRFVTAYEVVPGDPRVVHHAIVYQPEDETEAAKARQLDEDESGEGYTCFGGPRVNADPVALWAPGGGVIQMPAGTGVGVSGGRDLVLQMHYNVSKGSYPDRSRVHLRFAESGVKPALFYAVADGHLRLEPGRSYVETEATFELDPNDRFVAHGAMPHMHTLGRTLEVSFEIDGAEECFVRVDRWSFHWQNAWWYDSPKPMRDARATTIRCGYDTSTRSDVVTWGEGTNDEMCLSYFYVTRE